MPATTTTTPTPAVSTQSPRHHDSRFENVTPETPVLAAALLALVVLAVTVPGLALVLFGLPLAAILGVGTLATLARVLSR